MKKAKGIVWNLDELYQSADDPKLQKDIERAAEQANAFQQKHRGKIAAADCDADRLLNALKEYETLVETGYRPYAMANLLFAGDGKSDTHKALVAQVQDVMSRLDNETLFFSLEIQKIEQEQLQTMLRSGKLDAYRHYIESLRLFTPYTLQENEEQIINRKNLSGRTAFVNFFDEFTADFEWEFELDGEKKTLTQSELRELARHRDPEVRERAKRAHDGRYGDNRLIFTNVFGNIIKDHATEMELRGYDSPIQPTHLRNKVPHDVVKTMMSVTAENYELARRYYKLKAKLLGVNKLKGSDLLAPVSKTDRVIPFNEGKELVLDSFSSFSPEFGEIIGRAFTEKWIDAEIRPGKRGGAFCYSVAPSLHPYVLMNYVDNFDSVYTMAHEFGHALHTVISSEQQTLLSFHPPLVLAETASVFAEMLLTRKLLAEETERDNRIQIIASKLEDFFATISRQTMYTYFELDAHLEGAKRRLSADEFCQMWLKRREEMYKDAVDFLEEEQWFWSVIPHFIHTRFYCYAYTFGALFVLALFNQYEQEGDAFVPKYRGLLAAGDSDWPANQIQKIGLDFTDRSFWDGGFKVIESLLDELSELV